MFTFFNFISVFYFLGNFFGSWRGPNNYGHGICPPTNPHLLRDIANSIPYGRKIIRILALNMITDCARSLVCQTRNGVIADTFKILFRECRNLLRHLA